MSSESKKKILYIITKSVWAGAGKYTHDLATSLPKASEVLVEARLRPLVAAGGRGAMAEKIISAQIPYFEIKGFQRDVSFYKDILAFFEILSLLFKTKPDVIHVSSAKAGGIAGAAIFIYEIAGKSIKPFRRISRYVRSQEGVLLISGVQKIFTVHGWAFSETRPRWQIFLIKLFSKISCLFYDKIICVSEYDREIALKNKIAPEEKLLVIHNGIKPEEYDFLPYEEARKDIIRHLSAASGKNPDLEVQLPSDVWVGTIGEFTKNKGQKFLIEAIGKGIGVWLSVVGVIIGFGKEKRKLEPQITKYGLVNEVLLVENLPNPARCLKAFDIFVLPSLKEGLPYVLMEAGLAGIPIIATNVGGIPEIVEDGVSGILINPASADELAKAIKKLIENPDLCRELSAATREKILREFSFEKMLAETIKLYE